MSDDPMAPSPALRDFVPKFHDDDNEWWRLAPGDHLNLFEESIDECRRLDIENQVLRSVLDDFGIEVGPITIGESEPTEPRPLRVEVYRTEEEQPFRWRVVHVSNGKTMASGEAYADERGRAHAIEVLGYSDLEVVEVDG